MTTKNLLLMTQEILEEMGSDIVNSISDTEESASVAAFLRQSYEAIIDEKDWTFKRKLTTLTSLSDVNQPTKFTLPDSIHSIIWVKYNNADVNYKDPKEFYEMIKGRDTTSAVVDASGYRIDIDPSWWTSYDDITVEFDAYDAAVASTLTESLLTVYAFVELAWSHVDAFEPPVPSKFMQLIQDEGRSLSFTNILKSPNPKVEQSLRRKRAQMHGDHSAIVTLNKRTDQNINYGRK
jgi:hypothetical protein